jgi:hypothetical protein
VAVLAAFALIGSLFLRWYSVPFSRVFRIGGGGFELAFGVSPANAWNAVPATSVVLLVCALVVLAAVVAAFRTRARASIPIAIAGAVVAVAAAGLTLANPPTQRVLATKDGYFSRTRVGRQVVISRTLGAKGGPDAALGLAVVALAATVGLGIGQTRAGPPTPA